MEITRFYIVLCTYNWTVLQSHTYVSGAKISQYFNFQLFTMTYVCVEIPVWVDFNIFVFFFLMTIIFLRLIVRYICTLTTYRHYFWAKRCELKTANLWLRAYFIRVQWFFSSWQGREIFIFLKIVLKYF